MKTLRQIIDDVGYEQNGLYFIKPEFTGYINDHPVIVQAILERTAVVYPPKLVHDKFVANLGVIQVEEDQVQWFPKSHDDQRIWRSQTRSRAKGQYNLRHKEVTQLLKTAL